MTDIEKSVIIEHFERELSKYNHNSETLNKGLRTIYGKKARMLSLLLDMAKKQLPEKPIRANRLVKEAGMLVLKDENEYWKCPKCVNYDVLLRENQKYCHWCGQAIDWSGTE